MSFKSLIGAAVALSLTAGAATAWGQSPVLAWKAQLGSSGNDYAYGVAVDSAGNAYITGYTNGSLGGTNQGSDDAFLAKYSSTGSLAWKTQLGSSANDQASGVAVDSAGNAYITGYAGGNLDGMTQVNSPSAFLAKYDSTGSVVWKAQLASAYAVRGVAVDSVGNAYITGSTFGSLGGPNQGSSDAFLVKYSSTGSLTWKTQLGSWDSDSATGVAVDSVGNAYITGYTFGSLGGTNQGSDDAFLAKYDSAGSLIWKTQLGTSSADLANAVAVDSEGNVYITGDTGGNLGGTNRGSIECFLAKYDSTGRLVRTIQFGSSGSDFAYGVAVDSAGNAYITGRTDSSLGGTNQGSWDAFLVNCDSTGSLTWETQIGSSDSDQAFGVAVDSAGNAYITGYTEGDMGGTNQGGQDAFLVKYDVPEPATLALLALGGLGLIRRRRE